MPTADLGTSFPGIDAGTNQEVIQSNNLLYGSLLNLADAYEKAGKDVSDFSSYLETASKMATKTADECKAMADELGKLSTVNINGELFSFRGIQRNDLTTIVDKVNKQLETTKQKLNVVSKTSEKAERSGRRSGRQTAKTWKDTADGIGNSADKAVMAIDSVSGAFGGASSGLSGVVGDIVELIKNPLTGAIAGVGFAIMGVVALGKQLWDRWNVSIEEMKQDAEFFSNLASEAQKKEQGKASRSQSEIDRLKEINQDGISNNLELIEAEKLIASITKRLIELGKTKEEIADIPFGIVGEKVQGLETVEAMLDLGKFEQGIQKQADIVETAAKSVNIAFKEASSELSGQSFFNITPIGALNKGAIKGAKDIKDFRFNAAETDVKMIRDPQGTFREIVVPRDEAQVAFEKAWNSLMDESNLQGILKLLEERMTKETTTSGKENISALYTAIQKMYEEEQHLLEMTQGESTEYISNLAKNTREYEQAVKKEVASKADEFKKLNAEFTEQKRRDLLEPTDEKRYANLNNELSSVNADRQKKEDALLSATADVLATQSSVNELTQKFRQGEGVSIVEIREAQEAYLKAINEKTKIENDITDFKLKQLEIEKQMYEIEKRRKEKIYNANKNLSNQGVKLMVDTWQKINPFQATKWSMIQDFQSQKGERITADELRKIEQLTSLQLAFSDLQKVNLSNAQILTNDLTQRGGWKGGAVAPNIDRVNQQISNSTAQSAALLQQIRYILRNGLYVN